MKICTNKTAPSTTLAIIVGGVITGTLQVILSLSYAALIYGRELQMHLANGIGLVLAGAFVTAVFIALFAALPGTVGSNQDVSVAIFSIISVSIVTSLPATTPSEVAFYTVVLTISLSIILTGVFFLLLGTFRLGGLVRYFPYPVVGGFLAGTGWLLFQGGFSLAAGRIDTESALTLPYLLQWMPGMVFALALLFTIKKTANNFVIPGFILAGISLFYLVSWRLGVPFEQLQAEGWLLGPISTESLWDPVSFDKLRQVEWRVIADQTANIITVILVSSIALLLNASAFELESRQEIDFNQELRIAGMANIISGCNPGFVGFRQLCLTILNYRMGTQSRIVGIIGATIILLTLIYGAAVISYFPRMIIGGLLMYLGLNFLMEWAVATWFALPKVDFAIIWLVLIVIAVFGFLPGVTLGLVAAVIMFIVSYSRTDVVRHQFTGKTYQSLSPRRPEQRRILDVHGEQIYILQLQGFIFFGTANQLFQRVRQRLDASDQTPASYVTLDFRRVKILDSTGMLSFRKLKDYSRLAGAQLLLTAPSPEIYRQLTRGGLLANQEFTHYFHSLAEGIEWCEEQILNHWGNPSIPCNNLVEQLSLALPDCDCLDELLQCFDRLEIASGSTIIANGKQADSFFFLESGRVTAHENVEHTKKSNPCDTFCDGQLLGDISFYLSQKQIMDIIAVEDCIIQKLSGETLRRLEQENPALASLLHRAMARLFAERLSLLMKNDRSMRL